MREGSKLPLLLTELAIMLLIFALCAAVCLSVFAASRKTAAESGKLGNAAAWAQSAAEAYRAAKGDAESAAALLGAEGATDGFVYYLDGDWAPSTENGAVYTLTLSETDDTAAHIVVLDGAASIFTLDVKAVAYGN